MLAPTLVFRPKPTRLPGPKADARADGAPKKAQEEHYTSRFLAMMPRAITGESQPLENLGTDLRSVPSCECGGEDAAPLGASDGNSDELHCVVGFNPHKNGALAVLLGVTDSCAHIRCGSDHSPRRLQG